MGKLLAAATMALLVGVSLGRAADIQLGNDGGRYVIFVSGDIVEGDDQRFRAAAENVAQAVVSLSSPGGSFVSGLQIAAIVHDRGYATIVAAGERCASVCGVIWLSGSTRYLTPSSKVGFHGVYNVNTGQEASDANAVLGAYLRDIGLSIEAIAYTTRADASSMEWLSAADADRLGIKYTMVQIPNPEASQEFGRSVTSSALPDPPSSAGFYDPEGLRRLPSAWSPKIWQSPPGQSRGSASRRVAIELQPSAASQSGASPVLEDDQQASEVSAWLDGYYEYFNHPNGELRAEAIKSWYRNDVVGYYGKSVSPDTIVADKFTFAERWPVRSYRIRSGSIAVKHTALRGIEDPTDAVRVTGIVDWRCESPERRQVSNGSASFEYILFPKAEQSYADHGFRISTEDMKILSRRVEAMDTAVCTYSRPPYSGPCVRKQ